MKTLLITFTIGLAIGFIQQAKQSNKSHRPAYNNGSVKTSLGFIERDFDYIVEIPSINMSYAISKREATSQDINKWMANRDIAKIKQRSYGSRTL